MTYLRLEVVGPRMIFVTATFDLTGEDTESRVADPVARAGGEDQWVDPRWSAQC